MGDFEFAYANENLIHRYMLDYQSSDYIIQSYLHRQIQFFKKTLPLLMRQAKHFNKPHSNACPKNLDNFGPCVALQESCLPTRPGSPSTG